MSEDKPKSKRQIRLEYLRSIIPEDPLLAEIRRDSVRNSTNHMTMAEITRVIQTAREEIRLRKKTGEPV